MQPENFITRYDDYHNLQFSFCTFFMEIMEPLNRTNNWWTFQNCIECSCEFETMQTACHAYKHTNSLDKYDFSLRVLCPFVDARWYDGMSPKHRLHHPTNPFKLIHIRLDTIFVTSINSQSALECSSLRENYHRFWAAHWIQAISHSQRTRPRPQP